MSRSAAFFPEFDLLTPFFVGLYDYEAPYIWTVLLDYITDIKKLFLVKLSVGEEVVQDAICVSIWDGNGQDATGELERLSALLPNKPPMSKVI